MPGHSLHPGGWQQCWRRKCSARAFPTDQESACTCVLGFLGVHALHLCSGPQEKKYWECLARFSLKQRHTNPFLEAWLMCAGVHMHAGGDGALCLCQRGGHPGGGVWAPGRSGAHAGQHGAGTVLRSAAAATAGALLHTRLPAPLVTPHRNCLRMRCSSLCSAHAPCFKHVYVHLCVCAHVHVHACACVCLCVSCECMGMVWLRLLIACGKKYHRVWLLFVVIQSCASIS